MKERQKNDLDLQYEIVRDRLINWGNSKADKLAHTRVFS